MSENKETRWLRGAHTFPFMRVGSGKRRARAFELRERAADRMVILFRKGVYGDRLARPGRRREENESELRARAEFARLPVPTKMRILAMKRKELEEDLRDMEFNGSQIARSFHMPDILRNIEIIDDEIRRLERGSEE